MFLCLPHTETLQKKKKECISPSMSFMCSRTNSMFWNKNGVRQSFGFPIIACLHRLIAFAGRSIKSHVRLPVTSGPPDCIEGKINQEGYETGLAHCDYIHRWSRQNTCLDSRDLGSVSSFTCTNVSVYNKAVMVSICVKN